jgi:hypothetical protein
MIQQLQITDASGRVISEVNIHSDNALITTPAQQMKAGYYFIKITGEGVSSTLPFVKQ